MFEQYISEIKEKPFIIAFLILSVLGVVCYSYHFLPIYTADDEMFILGSWSQTFASGWKKLFHYESRSIGFAISTLFNDGTNGKNLVLFINLIGCSFLSLFFVRFGLGVKSIFWSILIAVPLFINTPLRVHYAYNVNLIRYIPMLFVLATTLAVIVKNKWQNMLFAIVVLTVAMWVYQLTVSAYVAGVIILTFNDFIKQQDQDLKPLFINILKNRVIPSIIVFILSMLALYLILGNLYRVYKSYWIPPAEAHRILMDVLKYFIYNLYPATFNHGIIIFQIFFFTTFVSLFYIFRKQKMQKQIFLSLLLTVGVYLSYIVINYGLIYGKWFPPRLRLLVGDILPLVFCIYVIQLALNNVRWLKNINTVLLFVFVMQMGNQVVYYSYKQLLYNKAKQTSMARMISDVINFMNDNNIKKPMPVLVQGIFTPGTIERFEGNPKKLYLHWDNTNSLYTGQITRHFQHMMILLGAPNNMLNAFYINNSKDAKKYLDICHKMQGDKNMPAWPYKGSIKIIENTVVVKAYQSRDKNFCKYMLDHDSYVHALAPTKIRLRDGYYNMGHQIDPATFY